MPKKIIGSNKKNNLTIPDITLSKKPNYPYTLDQVGMSGMEMPITIQKSGKEKIQYGAKVTVCVNLKSKDVKGVHMSRLYLLCYNFFSNKVLSDKTLEELMRKLIESQSGVSDSAYLEISFSHIKTKSALLSKNVGTRFYPIKIRASLEKNQFKLEEEIQLIYSSTCPCSAALSLQLIGNKIVKKLSNKMLSSAELDEFIKSQEDILAATPHSQRSVAHVLYSLKNTKEHFKFDKMINQLEKVLVTPVQTAVKRIDEQEFAKLNAENLMFCEDAARKLKNFFEKHVTTHSYSVCVEHKESLHAHDAVAKVSG